MRDDAAQVVIDAAYRALASLYHPDRNPSAAATRQMIELNRAYALVRTRDLRQVYNRLRTPVRTERPAASVNHAPRSQAPQPDVLTFGRYVGWSLRDLARHDPDYLRWLSRHTSGVGHRRRILELLAARTAQSAFQPVGGR